MADRQAPIEHTVVTVGVDDIDKALEKISSLGGSAVGEKMDVGGMGWAAYFKDSEGNVVGLWQTA
jgi:predicted enzyme related to lactoylglutathione lyase